MAASITVERSSLALGRKNYLFAGTHAAAARIAVLYSAIHSCKMRGMNAHEYLTDVLQRLAAGWPQRRIDELRPGDWAPAA